MIYIYLKDIRNNIDKSIYKTHHYKTYAKIQDLIEINVFMTTMSIDKLILNEVKRITK